MQAGRSEVLLGWASKASQRLGAKANGRCGQERNAKHRQKAVEPLAAREQ